MDRSHPRVKISSLFNITYTKSRWSNENVIIDYGIKWYSYLKNKDEILYDLVVNVFLTLTSYFFTLE